jgi:hypothetical protein
MKSKEEIQELANEFSKDYIKTTNNSILQSSFKLEVGYIKGYTQCQEDNDWTKIDEKKLNLIIAKMEEERDKHFKSSAEYIEKDEIINSILDTIRKCTVK